MKVVEVNTWIKLKEKTADQKCKFYQMGGISFVLPVTRRITKSKILMVQREAQMHNLQEVWPHPEDL